MGDVHEAFAKAIGQIGGTYDRASDDRLMRVLIDGLEVASTPAERRHPRSQFYEQSYLEALSVARVLVLLEADVDQGFAAVALTNHGAMGPRPCTVVEYALRAARAQHDAHALPPALTIEPALPVPNAFEYAKTFRSVDGRSVTFVEHGGSLALRDSGGVEHRADNRGGDSFFFNVPQFALSTIDFFRDDREHVVEFFYLNDWYRTDAYRGPAADAAPANLVALTGHYRLYEDSLNARILIRHGRLWLDGSGAMWPAGNGTYGVGERWTPERYRFDTFAGGVAQRLFISGTPLVRTFTP